MDAQLPVVAVDYMRRERRGAVLQCGGNNRSPSIKQLLCPPHPPLLGRYSQDAAPEADGRAHFAADVAETTGSL